MEFQNDNKKLQNELDSINKKNKILIADNTKLNYDLQKNKKRLQELDAACKELRNTIENMKADVKNQINLIIILKFF